MEATMTPIECRPLAVAVPEGGYRGGCECGCYTGPVHNTGAAADRTLAMVDARLHADGPTRI